MASYREGSKELREEDERNSRDGCTKARVDLVITLCPCRLHPAPQCSVHVFFFRSGFQSDFILPSILLLNQTEIQITPESHLRQVSLQPIACLGDMFQSSSLPQKSMLLLPEDEVRLSSVDDNKRVYILRQTKSADESDLYANTRWRMRTQPGVITLLNDISRI